MNKNILINNTENIFQFNRSHNLIYYNIFRHVLKKNLYSLCGNKNTIEEFKYLNYFTQEKTKMYAFLSHVF